MMMAHRCPVCDKHWNEDVCHGCGFSYTVAAPVGEPAAMPAAMPEIQVGDLILPIGPFRGYGLVDHQPQADHWKQPENAARVFEIYRPIWRRADRKETTA